MVHTKNRHKTEKEQLAEIRKASIAEGKSINVNAVEVVCREEDIFHK
jgi:hypothetical protein